MNTLFGTVAFPILDTVEATQAAAFARPEAELAAAYRVITNTKAAPTADAIRATLGEALAVAWYTEQGKELPVALRSKKTPAAKAADIKRREAGPAAANRGLAAAVREAIAANPTADDAAIFNLLKDAFPKMRIFSVRYYRVHTTGRPAPAKKAPVLPPPAEPAVPDSTDPAQLSALDAAVDPSRVAAAGVV